MSNNGGVTVISGVETTAPSVLKTISVGRAFLNAISITPDGQYVYVAEPCCGENNVSVIGGAESAAPKLVTTLTGFSRPSGIAFTPDGQHGYVTNEGTDTVSVIGDAETASPAVAGTLTVGRNPGAVAVDQQLVGIYAEYPSTARATGALDDGWPRVGC